MKTAGKDGSSMSSKQLARTVKDGKLLTFHLSTGQRIKGFLCGMDDYHWMIITPDAEVHLVHKGSAMLIDLAASSTYDESNVELEKVVAPFRKFVNETYFGIKAVAS